jgi:hypothetical protein
MSRGVTEPAAKDGTGLLTTCELALRWRMSQRTLERWRSDRFGPPWLAIGGRILYREDDIKAFEDRHRKVVG